MNTQEEASADCVISEGRSQNLKAAQRVGELGEGGTSEGGQTGSAPPRRKAHRSLWPMGMQLPVFLGSCVSRALNTKGGLLPQRPTPKAMVKVLYQMLSLHFQVSRLSRPLPRPWPHSTQLVQLESLVASLPPAFEWLQKCGFESLLDFAGLSRSGLPFELRG